MPLQDLAQPFDFIGSEEGRCATAEVLLDHFSVADSSFAKCAHLPVQVIEVIRSFLMLRSNDGGATAKPAEGLAERDVAVE